MALRVCGGGADPLQHDRPHPAVDAENRHRSGAAQCRLCAFLGPLRFHGHHLPGPLSAQVHFKLPGSLHGYPSDRGSPPEGIPPSAESFPAFL